MQKTVAQLELLRTGAPPISAEDLARLDAEWTKYRNEWVRRRKIFNTYVSLPFAPPTLFRFSPLSFWALVTDALPPQESAALAEDLGILEPNEKIAYRATFIIDPQGIIRWVSVNDLSVGHNVKEVLRVLDGLQTDELCPCNWEKGQETLTV